MGGLIQYPHVFYYWKRYSRRLYPPSAYGLGGLDMSHVFFAGTTDGWHVVRPLHEHDPPGHDHEAAHG